MYSENGGRAGLDIYFIDDSISLRTPISPPGQNDLFLNGSKADPGIMDNGSKKVV
jgi:hypothetical protein